MGNNLSTSAIVRIDQGRVIFFHRRHGSQAIKELEMDPGSAESGERTMTIEQLPNDLWLDIMSYLSFRDLQQFRMVNWRCRELVNRRNYLKKGKVIVTKDNLKEMKKHVERGLSYLNFEHLELHDLTQSRELEQFLKLVGPEVNHMLVRHAPVFRNMNGQLPNLKKLTIATTSTMDDVNLNVDGINMKQFLHLDGFECDGVSLDTSLKLLMLKQLRRVENKVSLRSLQFEYRRNNETELLEVLYDHAPTLERIDIFFSCSPGVDTYIWREAFERMENLRSIKLSGNCHLVLLDDILHSIPQVAPLNHLDLTGMLSLSNDMLDCVADKWYKTMRHIDLMFCVQLDVRCTEALRRLSGYLESLVLSYCRAMNGYSLIMGLTSTPNYVLQELFLEDVCFVDEDSMCTLLSRLPNLRKLCLNNCRQATTDKTLSTIFKHMVLLRTLKIDYCTKVTDYGFIGFGKQPYPITRLRGLRRLTLRGVRNLTDKLLRKALHLPELLSLTLDYCNRMQPKGVTALSINCPSLELLHLASCLQIDDGTVHTVVTNLKRLRSFNISNCSLLSLRSIHHIADHAHNLRELIACSIDGLDYVAAEKILKRQLPQLKQVML